VTGTAEAGATINLYTSSNCTSNNVGTGTATGGSFSIVTSSLPSDTPTTLYVKATDAATNASTCSSIAYTEDSTAPTAPTVTASNPVSPSNTNTAPTVSGAAESGSTVKIYSGACTGSAIATTTATVGGTYSVVVNVGSNSTTTFRAQATDAATNVSACSTVNLAYTHDNQAPTTPTSFAISPVGPANNNSPNATGNAETGATVAIYANGTCTAPSAASGTASGGAFTIGLSVTNNTNNTFSAKATDAAGNPSGCTAAVAYIEDSAAPTSPTFTVSTPASPSNTSTTPTIKGVAEANASVTLFTNSACTGAAAYTGSANSSGVFSIPVTITANSSVTFYAKATDAALNASACSSGPAGSYTYAHDNQIPTVPVMSGINPNSPANENAPVLSGTAEAGVTVYVYAATPCTTPIAQGVATGGNYAITVNVGDNTESSLYVKATDAASNSSACSTTPLNYEEDSEAPQQPSIGDISPKSPSSSNVVEVSGNTDQVATIKFYSDKLCQTALPGQGSSLGDGSYALNVTVPSDTTTTIWATATDAAGNVSDCSGGIDYVEDSTAPATPTGLGSTPTSPANNNTPNITGTAEPGTLVQVFTTSNCTGAAFSGTSISSTFSVAVSIANDTQTTYYANSTDSAGNVSGCSAGFAFREDSSVATPSITGSTPGSPSVNNTSPQITGNAEANGTVRIYSGNSCAGASIAQVTAGAGGTFTVSVTLSANTVNVITAKVTDLANNVSGCSAPFVYIHDNTVPTMAAPSSATATSQSAILVTWASGTDNITMAANLRYDVCWKTSIGGACVGTATTTAGVTNHTITGLATGVRYYISVRAVDNPGNAGTYMGPVSERTWGTGATIQIASGYQHSCALIADGTVKCWGINTDGQIGDATNLVRSAPTLVGPANNPLDDVIQIGVGGSAQISNGFSCAVRVEGSVWCWGSGVTYGELGDGNSTNSNVPVKVTGISNATQVALGTAHACALLANGGVKCWGLGAQGQLGNGVTGNSSTPVDVSSITTAVAVDVGMFHSCALLADGSARCWGSGSNGRLGNGLGTGSSVPVTVSLAATDRAKAIDAGNFHTCVLLTTGQMRCWGANGAGQLGRNNTTDATTPVTVTTDGSTALVNVAAISAGGGSNSANTYGTTCAVLATGAMRCWGYNASGQVGDATTTSPRLVPQTVSGAANVTQVSVGQEHVCGLGVNGSVKCVGNGSAYQLGTGNTTSISTPASVANLFGPERGVAIRGANGSGNYGDGYFTCALMSNGVIRCWGDNPYGQLGISGSPSTATPTDTVHDSGNNQILAKQIGIGGSHACALLSDGTVRCWGLGTSGQLGDGTIISKSTGVLVSGLTNAISISSGNNHSCALLSNGDVKCWGHNTWGQLGNGGTTQAATPQNTGSGASKVLATTFGGCLINGDGTMKCWGYDFYGDCGAGTATTTTPFGRLAPTTVTGMTNATAIGSSRWGACALTAGGTAKCWGAGISGQMGNGAASPMSAYPTPVTVNGIAYTSIAGGEFFSVALKLDSVPRGWGEGLYGQLGNNLTTQQNAPVSASTSAVKDLGPGRQHTCALLGDGTAQCWGSSTNGTLGDGNLTAHQVNVPQTVIYFP
jgi:alpha-tubulin suppressor-like RCC1 family protein